MDIVIGRDYFLIDGKPRFIFGGDFNYARTPRLHWRDRLLKLKAAGVNTITFYCTWSYHEPEQGAWDWSGDKDVAHFLDLIHEEGLWAIFRMGPFIHGEWRNGGLPQWLLDKLGTKVRTNDPEYLRLARLWYEQVLKIVVPRQITKGGPIVIIQLENELGSAGSKGDDVARGSTDPEENAKHYMFYSDIIREYGVDLPRIDINTFPGSDKIPNLIEGGGNYVVNFFGGEGEFGRMSAKQWETHQRPLTTIETAGGMCCRYFDWPPYQNTNGFQGPIFKPEYVEATTYGHLAEGCNAVCYYQITDGQYGDDCAESMLPERDMNFQTPITTVGTLRESYKIIKRIGWFLRAFEQELLASQPWESWVKATSYGQAHPGVQTTGDLFEGYHKAAEPIADHLAHVTEIDCLGRATAGLNLSESNFAFLRNTRVHGSHWRRDIRLVTCPNKLACELPNEYPKYVQLALPPQRNKCMPFFVRLAPHMFLEYSTAELLDRRPYGDGTQVILHADAEEVTETRLVLPAQAEVKRLGATMPLWNSPNTLTLIGTTGPEMEIVQVGGPTPLRIVLLERNLAGEVWDVAARDGAAVAMSNLRILGSSREDNATKLIAQTDQSDFYFYMLTDAKPKLAGPFADLTDAYNPEFGLYRATGSLQLPERSIDFQKRKDGCDLVWEADVQPGLLDGVLDLVLRAEYDGTLGKAFLDGRLISDHGWGRYLFWEIGLRDWLRNPGRLQIRFENCREAKLEVRPVIEFEAHLGSGLVL